MVFSYGRAVAKIVCSLFGDDTLVQYAACFESSQGGKGTIRFRLLWWGWCFTLFLFAGECFNFFFVMGVMRRGG